MKIRRNYVATVGVCVAMVLTLVFGVIAYNITMPAELLFILSPAILYIIFAFILINFFEDSGPPDRHELFLDEFGRHMEEITELNKIFMKNEIKNKLHF